MRREDHTSEIHSIIDGVISIAAKAEIIKADRVPVIYGNDYPDAELDYTIRTPIRMDWRRRLLRFAQLPSRLHHRLKELIQQMRQPRPCSGLSDVLHIGRHRKVQLCSVHLVFEDGRELYATVKQVRRYGQAEYNRACEEDKP